MDDNISSDRRLREHTRNVAAPATDSVTVLTSLSGKYMTKRHGSDGTKQYDNEKWFSVHEEPVADIHSLAKFLDIARTDPHSCIIREAPKPSTNQRRTRRRGTHFASVSRSWAMLDIDGVPCPAGVDPIDDPDGAIEFLVGLLPEAFQDATLYWQWSASQGVKDDNATLNAHLFVWLTEPRTGAELKRWASQANMEVGRKLIDPAPFNNVQAHYVADPIFEDGKRDPLPRRSGTREGLDASVHIASIPIAGKQLSPNDRPNAACGRSVEDYIGLIGEPIGFHQPVLSAYSAFFHENGPDADAGEIRESIKAAILSADAGHRKDSEIERYASDRFHDDIINWMRQRERGNSAISYTEDVPFYNINPLPLAEAEAQLAETVSNFFHGPVKKFALERSAWSGPDSDEPEPYSKDQWGIKIDMGGGKTHAAIQGIVEAVESGFTSAFFIEQHTPAAEIEHRLNDAAGRRIARVWRGFEQLDPDGSNGETMCRFPEAMREILAAKGKWSQLCGTKTTGECQYKHNGCGYRAQRRERDTPVWILTSSMLPRSRPNNIPKPDFIIIDETFTPSMLVGFDGKPHQLLVENLLETRFLKADFFPRHAENADLQSALMAIQTALERMPQDGRLMRSSFDGTGISANQCHLVAKLEWEFKLDIDGIVPEMSAEDARKALKVAGATNRKVARRVLFWNLLALWFEGPEELSPYLVRRRDYMEDGDADVIVMKWRETIHDNWAKSPVLYMDGTMNERIARQWLPHLEVKADIKIETPNVYRRIVVDQPVIAKKTVPDKNASARDQKTQRNNVAKIARFLEIKQAKYHGQGARNGDERIDVLAIGQKGMREELDTHVDRLGPHVATSHLNGLRGVDRFKGVPYHFQTNRLLPQPWQVEALATVIFGRVVDEINPDENGKVWYQSKERTIGLSDGRRVAVDAPYHPDPDVEAVRWQICEAELLQAEARSRGVRRTALTPLMQDFATNVVVPLVFDEAVTWAQLMTEVEPLKLLVSRGIVPKDSQGISEVLPELFSSARAVRTYVSKNPHVAPSVAHFHETVSNSYRYISIGVRNTFVRYRYRRAGARKSHSVLVDVGLHADPRAAVELWFGDLDLFELEHPFLLIFEFEGREVCWEPDQHELVLMFLRPLFPLDGQSVLRITVSESELPGRLRFDAPAIRWHSDLPFIALPSKWVNRVLDFMPSRARVWFRASC